MGPDASGEGVPVVVAGGGVRAQILSVICLRFKCKLLTDEQKKMPSPERLQLTRHPSDNAHTLPSPFFSALMLFSCPLELPPARLRTLDDLPIERG